MATIGIALGGGGARGWAHIGVLAALAEHGIHPDVVCGTSIGALVGGIYAAGRLTELERWAGALTRRDVIGLVDLSLGRGGAIAGQKLLDLYRAHLDDVRIEKLPRRFAAVATDLESGDEVWLREGSLLEAIRASISVPGVFTPVPREGRWLVDGALVNPVPVTLCRALGAEVVIAVDLTGRPALQLPRPDETTAPRLRSVLTAALDIMQDRISRSRLAGDPPDLLLHPRVQHVSPLEFTDGRATIEEGYATVQRMRPALDYCLEAGRGSRPVAGSS